MAAPHQICIDLAPSQSPGAGNRTRFRVRPSPVLAMISISPLKDLTVGDAHEVLSRALAHVSLQESRERIAPGKAAKTGTQRRVHKAPSHSRRAGHGPGATVR